MPSTFKNSKGISYGYKVKVTSCIRSGQTKKFIDQWEKDHPVPKK